MNPTVAALWRYPVKSMLGERCDELEVDARGAAGDRLYAVRDAEGKYYSFRKGDVQNIDKQTGRSLMPTYRDKLSTAQLEDVVAYLASLGGKK